jgi:hypothetical protein
MMTLSYFGATGPADSRNVPVTSTPMQKLQKKYGDKITFVKRYFPLPSHRNSTTAALQ